MLFSTLIKENTFDSTGNGCGLFPESRKQKPKKIRQIVRRRHDGLEFESGHNNAHWLQMVAFFSQKKKLRKRTNILKEKKSLSLR